MRANHQESLEAAEKALPPALKSLEQIETAYDDWLLNRKETSNRDQIRYQEDRLRKARDKVTELERTIRAEKSVIERLDKAIVAAQKGTYGHEVMGEFLSQASSSDYHWASDSTKMDQAGNKWQQGSRLKVGWIDNLRKTKLW